MFWCEFKNDDNLYKRDEFKNLKLIFVPTSNVVTDLGN